jgi:CBS domain-containing protein
MTRVSDVMRRPVEYTHIDESLHNAANRMRLADVRLLPVLDGDRLVGVVSDSDLATRATAEGRDPDQGTVREVLTPKIVYCRADDSVEQARAAMSEAQVRNLPVLDQDGALVGMVSTEDLAPGSAAAKPRSVEPGVDKSSQTRGRPAAYDTEPHIEKE